MNDSQVIVFTGKILRAKLWDTDKAYTSASIDASVQDAGNIAARITVRVQKTQQKSNRPSPEYQQAQQYRIGQPFIVVGAILENWEKDGVARYGLSCRPGNIAIGESLPTNLAILHGKVTKQQKNWLLVNSGYSSRDMKTKKTVWKERSVRVQAIDDLKDKLAGWPVLVVGQVCWEQRGPYIRAENDGIHRETRGGDQEYGEPD